MIENFYHNRILYKILFIGGFMQYLVFIVKKIVTAICMLYTFDLIIMSSGIIVPINVYTIVLTSILGLPAIFIVIILKEVI